jgi:hypothetical protein
MTHDRIRLPEGLWDLVPSWSRDILFNIFYSEYTLKELHLASPHHEDVSPYRRNSAW